MGRVKHGIYLDQDEVEGVSPDVLERYYGTTGHNPRRRADQTGAGHPPDEEDDDDEGDEEGSLPQRIAADHEQNFLDTAVKAPRHSNPFRDETVMAAFTTALAQVQNLGHIPRGFGMLPDEWENEEYPTFEVLRSGRRGTKELRIALPDRIWRPRAVRWVQALDVMSQLIERTRSNDEYDFSTESSSGTEDGDSSDSDSSHE